jgi:hypothetical protein
MKGKCLNCQSEFNYSPSQSKGKYCSNKCQINWQRKQKVENGLTKNVPSIKLYLQEVRGNKCELCNCDPIHNGKPLKFELHHKDGNSDNNKIDNLQLVCPNCHSQIPEPCKKKNTTRSKINGLRKVSLLK